MVVKNILKNSPELLITYLEKYTDIMLLLLDNNFNILDCNSAFLNFLELEDKPVGKSIYEYVGKEDIEYLELNISSEAPLNTSLTVHGVNETMYTVNCNLFLVDDKYVMFWEKVILTETQVVEKMSVLNEELTNLTRELSKKNAELKKANDKITRLLRTDSLTDIYNRRFFMEELERSISLMKRHKISFSVAVADLDKFKSVNDNWGHGIGDRVLIHLSELLQNICRKEDVPARIGGEEFAILLPHTTLEEAVNFTERLRKKLASQVIDPLPEPVTCSFGVTQIVEEDTADSVMKRADEALYRAKDRGRNKVEQNKLFS